MPGRAGEGYLQVLELDGDANDLRYGGTSTTSVHAAWSSRSPLNTRDISQVLQTGRATTRSALRHAEGTASAALGVDRPKWSS